MVHAADTQLMSRLERPLVQVADISEGDVQVSSDLDDPNRCHECRKGSKLDAASPSVQMP